MGASLYDEYKGAQAAPDTTPAASLYDEYKAAAPKADTLLDDGDGGKIMDASNPRWSGARDAYKQDSAAFFAANPESGEQPNLWERIKATGRSMLPQSGETVPQAVGRDAVGLVKGAVQPFATLAKEGAYQMVDPLHLGNTGHLPFDRPQGLDVLKAAPAALGTVLAPGISGAITKAASPFVGALTGRVLGGALTGSGVGAAYSPDDPAQGAVLGGVLGGAHVAASEGLPSLPSRTSIATTLAPDLARKAASYDAIRSPEAVELRQLHTYLQNVKSQYPATQAAVAESVAQAHARIAELTGTPSPLAAEYAQSKIAPHEPTTEGPAGDAPLGVPESSTPVAAPPAPALRAGGVDVPASATTVATAAVDATAQPRLADTERAVDAGVGEAGGGGPVPAGHDAAVEFRNAGIPELRGFSQGVKNVLDRPYAALERAPNDLAVRDALLAAGAGRGHGMNVAQYGMGHVRAGLDAPTVQGIEARIFADNFEMQAQSRAAAGDHGAADNLRVHAELAASQAPSGVERTPEYQQYVSRYRDVMEPHYNAVAKAAGLDEANFRDVKPGSVYVPLPADIADAPPDNVIRPPRAGLPGTKQSSAVKVASGGAAKYVIDAQHAAEKFLPERTKVAAQNDLWQAVRTRGRELTSRDGALEPGEELMAFNDKNQITAPESEDAVHYVALPKHVNDAVQQYLDRRDIKPLPYIARGNRFLTAAATVASPAIGLTHGGNIAGSVNMIPTGTAGDLVRTAASAVPFGNTLAGIADIGRADLTDAATLRQYLAVSKYGGTQELSATPDTPPSTFKKITGKVHHDLFGKNGIDARGRAVAAQRLRATNPEMSDAEIAQKMGQMFGQYNKLNAPAASFYGQHIGATSFAPAGIGFTTQAAKRLTGQAGLGQFVKGVAAPVAGAIGLNYAMSGHSPLKNDAGHRGDIDLGYKNDNLQEQYLKSSYAYPLLNRAANTTGVRPLLEGQGVTGAAGGAANEALAQLGVLPRAVMGALNAQPREKEDYGGLDVIAQPQFGDGNKAFEVARRTAAGALGAPAAIAGFSPFDLNQPLTKRLLNAGHANAVSSGRVGGSSDADRLYNTMQEKTNTAKQRIYQADTEAKQAQVIAQEVARAKADGYSGDALEMLTNTLQKAAEKSASDRAELRQASLAKRGFTP